jgi:CheY-like chemotaxis protein
MPLKVIVIGKTLIARQPIAQALDTLDFQVIEASEIAEAVSAVRATRPVLIVLDADGMAREWRMLAAAAGAQPQRPALVLLTSKFNFDDVHDAQALRVAAVIVKPFRREEHTERLLDLALHQRNIRAQRFAPRFAIPRDTKAELRIGRAGSADIFPVMNIAEGGAKVVAEAAWEPAKDGPPVTLSWGNVQLEVSVELIHRQLDGAGIRFVKIWEGAPKILRALEERQARALGQRRKKRKW